MASTTEIFAGYELGEVVGQGELGTIYRARDARLPRDVALRVVAGDLSHDPVTRARLNREATVLAACEHPNVLPIYEAGEFDGRLFVASRWVDGVSMADLVRDRGPLEPRQAVAIVEQVASALEAAHALGVIHRAVRPSSVLITPSGTAYLTDFGLARRSSDVTGLTIHDHLVDSFDFIAPEYISGGDVDTRADIYGLGCVLYVALTGETPYPLPSPAAKMYAHLSADTPSPRAVNDAVPEALDAVIQRALAKDPGDRQPTPAAFVAEAAAAFAAEAGAAIGEAGAVGEAAPDEPPAPLRLELAGAGAPDEPGAGDEPSPEPPSGGDFEYSVYRQRAPGETLLRGVWIVLALLFIAAPVALLVALVH